MATVANVLTQTQFTVRRKVLKLLGGAFHIYDTNEQVIGYSKMKAFKLKEDIRLYTSEDMTTELITIKARSIIDFGASYDVYDAQQGVKVGALRRKGLKSMIRDEWHVLDPQDRQIGMIQEDSTMLALVRRFIDLASYILPQKYVVTIGGQPVAYFQQNYNPFVYKLNVDLTSDSAGLFDRRLALASGLLMAAIEGKQS
jgi:uncharacterized protein YxjI